MCKKREEEVILTPENQKSSNINAKKFVLQRFIYKDLVAYIQDMPFSVDQ